MPRNVLFPRERYFRLSCCERGHDGCCIQRASISTEPPTSDHQARHRAGACRLGYKGLGEPLCFVAFGICAVVPAFVAMYRSVDASLTAQQLMQLHWPLVLPVTYVCGLTTTTVLFCSHFHQIEGDSAAGKQSPLVRLGSETGCKVRPPCHMAPAATCPSSMGLQHQELRALCCATAVLCTRCCAR